MYPLPGVWILDETVRVVFEILLHTVSILWAKASGSLTLWRAKCSLDHYHYAITIFPEIFFWHLVINGQFMPIDEGASGSTVCTKWVPLPYATWCFARCCPIFPSSYRLFLTNALWRNAYLKYWVRSGLACARFSDSIVGTYWNEQSENKTRATSRVFRIFFFLNDFPPPSWSLEQARSGQKATPTVFSLDFLLSFFVSSLVSLLYVLVTEVVTWRSHVTWRSLLRQASKYENKLSSLAITSE